MKNIPSDISEISRTTTERYQARLLPHEREGLEGEIANALLVERERCTRAADSFLMTRTSLDVHLVVACKEAINAALAKDTCPPLPAAPEIKERIE